MAQGDFEGGSDVAEKGLAAHLKRYGVFYGAAAAVAIVVAVLPSVGGDDDEGDRTNGEVASDGVWRPGSGDMEHGTGTSRRRSRPAPGAPISRSWAATSAGAPFSGAACPSRAPASPLCGHRTS